MKQLYIFALLSGLLSCTDISNKGTEHEIQKNKDDIDSLLEYSEECRLKSDSIKTANE